MSLRVVVRVNAGENYVELDRELWESRPDIIELDAPTLRREVLAFFRDKYDANGLPRENDYVVGHTAPLFLPAVSDRSVRAFCMLRDPVDRVLSVYFHVQRHVQQSMQARLPSPAFAGVVDAGTRAMWPLKEIYRGVASGSEDSVAERSYLADMFFNGQVKHLLMGAVDPAKIPLDPDDAELDRYRQQVDRLLADRYLVGTQDRFSQSVRLFADTFGWRAQFIPKINSNPAPRLRDKVDDETLELIRVYNRLDADLYAEHSERLSQMPSTSRVSDTRWKAQLQAAHRYRRLRRPLRRFRRRLRTRLQLRTRVAATVRRLRRRPRPPGKA